MFDIATLTKNMVADATRKVDTISKPLASDVVNNIFKMLHGYYGNLFLSKFATGSLDQDGHDRGIASGSTVWSHGIREFDTEVIGAALEQCIERHTEFPPSFPQFKALCKANQPRVTHRDQNLALPDRAPRAANAAQVREMIDRCRGTQDTDRGESVADNGLDGLKLLIAEASSLAGGDEAATLVRLDVMLPTKAKPARSLPIARRGINDDF